MRGKFVRLSVCLSSVCGAFCVARSQIPTAAFESYGLRYMRPIPTGSLRVGG